MPPQKKTPAAVFTAQETLALFHRNLEAMRRWYRGSTHAGIEMGHVVMQELVLANIMTALDLALTGKEWVAPSQSP